MISICNIQINVWDTVKPQTALPIDTEDSSSKESSKQLSCAGQSGAPSTKGTGNIN